MKHSRIITLLIILTALLPLGCTEDESPIGFGLQDPATIYNGIKDTLYPEAATIFDDSLLTHSKVLNYTMGVVGHYNDPENGSFAARLFTQMVPNSNDLNITSQSRYHADSAVLQLVISDIYPKIGARKNGSRTVHFRIDQLAQPIIEDTSYYSHDTLPVSGVNFFDGAVTLHDNDTIVRIPLNQHFVDLLTSRAYASVKEFLSEVKGMRIQLKQGDQTMISVDFSSGNSAVTLYLKYTNADGTVVPQNLTLSVGNKAARFFNFSHNYTGDLAQFNNPPYGEIPGNQYLYLYPMGGTSVKLSFENSLAHFRESHPYAIIHYAELILPVHSTGDTLLPQALMGYQYDQNGKLAVIPDQARNYGFDGKYDKSLNRYRVRLSQYLQHRLVEGSDPGLLLMLEGRRSSARHAVINGSNQSEKVRLEIIYTESYSASGSNK